MVEDTVHVNGKKVFISCQYVLPMLTVIVYYEN